MRWIMISEKYLSYLRNKESRIPYSNYGKDAYKPFFGVLFETEKFYYVTQVSSPKQRHFHMKQNLDFYKLCDSESNQVLAVVNLNYMFPVLKSEIEDLKYNNIDQCRTFKTEKEKSKYINFLKKEMKLINKLNLEKAARRVYELKLNYPNNIIAKRCIDFKKLEIYAMGYKS